MRNRNTSYPLAYLAEQIKGTLVGDPTLTIAGLCPLEAPAAHHITFIRSESPDSVSRGFGRIPASCAVILKEGLISSTADRSVNSPSAILVKEPYPAFLDLIPLFFEEIVGAPGIHPNASIDSSAMIGEGASIGAGCYVGPGTVIGKHFTMFPNARILGDVTIGDSVTLHAGVSIRHGTKIADRVTIHDNAVIGADGFGFTPVPLVGLRKVPQIGGVRIESDVEIGANACIDRGAFGPTVVGRGTKIDNLAQIGHNVVLGTYVVVCGQVGIAGSSTIADGVVLGGQAGVADHLSISKGVRVGGGSGVTTNLSEPGDYMGYPAIPAQEWRRLQLSFRKTTRRKQKK
jgi:UDP-3-O-[3-hydroxymyristoyl] glucosamine N-acyltransferase